MSEALGLATWEAAPRAAFLSVPGAPEQRECSERTAEAIDAEVRRLLEESRGRAYHTLTVHRAQLEALAHLLLEKETVDRGMLNHVLAGTKAAPATQKPVSGVLAP